MVGYVLQQILNGIQLGSIYALIALGYTMVYGIMRLINFAHADIFMIGAYIAFFVTSFYVGSSMILPIWIWVWLSLIVAYLLFDTLLRTNGRFSSVLGRLQSKTLAGPGGKRHWGWLCLETAVHPLCIVLVAAIVFPVLYYGTRFLFQLSWGGLFLPFVMAYVMLVCAMIGVAMEKIAYRPLRYKPRLSALITALGLSLFLENFCSLDSVFSNKYRAFPELVKKANLISLGDLGVSISNLFVLNVAVLLILLAALWFLIEKTLLGKQMRAVAFDKTGACLMGINVDRIISLTFVIGPALAGVSGILFAANYGILQSPFLGFTPGIKAFIAAVLGGIGSLPGAVLGALILGVVEVFANSVDSNLGFASAFGILIGILLFKPRGILGKSDIEKV